MYLDYFGLREQPFSITPNPRFLYMTPKHREAMDHLLFGVRQHRGFVVLTGDVGTGKTTLCRALLTELGESCRTALILNPSLSETQLLRAVLTEFNVADVRGDRLTLRETLNSLLLDELAARRDVVLIIDEAQHLSLEMLEQIRLLSNLETDDQKLLQIVLAGQPELTRKLADPRLRQLKQRISVRYQLVPLAPVETEGYIRHRLKVAGANARPSFDRRAIGRIHERSCGVPRLVNAISDVSLLAAYGARSGHVDTSHVESAIRDMDGIDP